MKKNILIFGLISGLIVSTLMSISMLVCAHSQSLEGSMILGYTIMLLSFSLIFVGIKNYRDNYNNGFISYGKAFRIGILISLVASTCYVITWAIVYHNFMPDFMDKWVAKTLSEAQQHGSSAQELKKMSEKLQGDAYSYHHNPLIFVAYTYMEIFPVGLLVTLITSAFLMKRKKQLAN
ncbi:MAG: DUF4199 domain-containing protein [Pedobacter sp.]|nr:DUF4199 domain-containing protein [Pedobacter sp.]